MSFSPTIEHDVTIHAAADGGFTAQDAFKKLDAHAFTAPARSIDSSLYLAAMQAGIPARVVVQMIHMFSYEVDFQRDLKPGDSFEVYYNYYYTPDGKPAKEGEIAYAAMHLLGRHGRALPLPAERRGRGRFFRRQRPERQEHADEDAGGWRAHLVRLRHALPSRARLHAHAQGHRFRCADRHASDGGRRRHDSDRRIGKTATAISSCSTTATATRPPTAHLSRFAPGIHAGSHVRQGQVIAYSGATGLATGPHLHYEIRINGVQVNPAGVKVARGRILAGTDLRDFQIERLHVDSEIAALPLEGKIADTATDLRAGKD